MKIHHPEQKSATLHTSAHTHTRPQRTAQALPEPQPAARHSLKHISIFPQERLTITSPGAPSEREANSFASHAVRQLMTSRQAEAPAQRFRVSGLPETSSQPVSPVARRLSHAIERVRGHGRPLAEPLRTSMEQALDTDLSHVRIHTDTQSDQLNRATSSYAFTTGQDIFFRRGSYNPHSRGGLDLLAHELTHVMQQQNHNPRHILIQRRFGVELQTSNQFVATQDPEITVLPDRKIAFENEKLGFTLESDEGHEPPATDLEFVTSPFATVPELLKAVEGAARLAANLAQGGGVPAKETGKITKEGSEEKEKLEKKEHTEEKEKLVKEEKLEKKENVQIKHKKETFDGGQWVEDVAIKINDPMFAAAMQATVGVPLAHLSNFLQEQLIDLDRVQETQHAKEIAGKYEGLYKKPEFPRVKSLIQAIIMYIHKAQIPNERYRNNSDSEGMWVKIGEEERYQLIEPEGPKFKMAPLMARTDFHAMYRSLKQEEQEEFDKIVFLHASTPKVRSTFLGALGNDLQQDDFVFKDPYRADETMQNQDPEELIPQNEIKWADQKHKGMILSRGPRLRDWLWSIKTGHKYTKGEQKELRGKDMLSAPPGWASRKPENVTKYPFPKQAIEPKTSYFGMGAYGMDAEDPEANKEPLAIFEHRGLNKLLRLVPSSKWVDTAGMVVVEKLKEGYRKEKK